jgi:hypothetical protein
VGLARRVEVKLGQLLVEDCILTEEELEQALTDRKNRGLAAKPIGKFLVEEAYLKERDVL